MDIILFFCGLGSVLLGLTYLKSPEKISKINAAVKEYLLNDRVLLMHRKKLGVFFIFIGILIVYIILNK